MYSNGTLPLDARLTLGVVILLKMPQLAHVRRLAQSDKYQTELTEVPSSIPTGGYNFLLYFFCFHVVSVSSVDK